MNFGSFSLQTLHLFSFAENIITGRNEVLAKVIFLHLSVILFTGGGLARRPPGWMEEPPPAGWRNPPGWMEEPPPWMENPPQMENPPRWRTPPPPRMENPPRWRTPPPPDGEPHPPGWRTPPPDGEPPPGSGLRHTVYDRPVRILLECILVLYYFSMIKFRAGKKSLKIAFLWNLLPLEVDHGNCDCEWWFKRASLLNKSRALKRVWLLTRGLTITNLNWRWAHSFPNNDWFYMEVQ